MRQEGNYHHYADDNNIEDDGRSVLVHEEISKEQLLENVNTNTIMTRPYRTEGYDYLSRSKTETNTSHQHQQQYVSTSNYLDTMMRNEPPPTAGAHYYFDADSSTTAASLPLNTATTTTRSAADDGMVTRTTNRTSPFVTTNNTNQSTANNTSRVGVDPSVIEDLLEKLKKGIREAYQITAAETSQTLHDQIRASISEENAVSREQIFNAIERLDGIMKNVCNSNQELLETNRLEEQRLSKIQVSGVTDHVQSPVPSFRHESFFCLIFYEY
jgi:BMFP domain-containing protein YqiC